MREIEALSCIAANKYENEFIKGNTTLNLNKNALQYKKHLLVGFYTISFKSTLFAKYLSFRVKWLFFTISYSKGKVYNVGEGFALRNHDKTDKLLAKPENSICDGTEKIVC